MDRSAVHIDSAFMDQLRAIKQLTGIPIQTWINRAVERYLDNDIAPILQTWGATAKDIDRVSQMRYGKEEKKGRPSPAAKKALA